MTLKEWCHCYRSNVFAFVQLTFICSRSPIEILDKGVKVNNKVTRMTSLTFVVGRHLLKIVGIHASCWLKHLQLTS